VPIGVLAIAAARFIPESSAADRPSLDWIGVLLVSSGLALLLVPLIEGPAQDWPAWSLGSLATSVLLLAAFYHHQQARTRAGQQPLVDMALLGQRRFAMGGLLVLLIYSTSSSFFLCFALLAQTGLGLDPFMAGSIFAPVGMLFGAVLGDGQGGAAQAGEYASAFVAGMRYSLVAALLVLVLLSLLARSARLPRAD